MAAATREVITTSTMTGEIAILPARKELVTTILKGISRVLVESAAQHMEMIEIAAEVVSTNKAMNVTEAGLLEMTTETTEMEDTIQAMIIIADTTITNTTNNAIFHQNIVYNLTRSYENCTSYRFDD